jgi:hypothetical protein
MLHNNTQWDRTQVLQLRNVFSNAYNNLYNMNLSSVSGPYSAIDPYAKPFLAPQLCSQP